MTKLRCCGSLLILVSGLALGQDTGGYKTYRPNQELRVPQLPALAARSRDPGDVLLTSLDIAFHDPSICCGRNSALEDRPLAADPLSLKEIASKIQGRWLLSDGRPVQVTADFLPQGGTLDISGRIIGSLAGRHPTLIVWSSHLYVLYGAVFDEVVDSVEGSAYMIHKLLLLDARYSDSRREVTFNRDTDDWGKVQGILLLAVTPQ
jgi:hypothetical protein